MITLKAARINANLTQAEAAKKLGVSVGTLGNYEKGSSYPDVLVIERIQKLYNVAYNEIDFFYNQKTIKS